MRERDVGLFSLVQQVVANIPWALADGRIPIAYFSKGCAYYSPLGYNGSDSVWEYYFEPLHSDFPAARIPAGLRSIVESDLVFDARVFWLLDGNILITNDFGDHRTLRGKALTIPHKWNDPNARLRAMTSRIMRQYVKPRTSIEAKAQAFYRRHLHGRYVIGVHVRGTDVISNFELDAYRRGSLVLDNFADEICELLAEHPDAAVMVATDDQSSLDRLTDILGECVIAHDSVRHESGAWVGFGPTGHQMPAYIADDPEKAARNGEEAVIEYLLLCRCQHLVHNGGGLARTVLLANADLAHTNVHLKHTPVSARVSSEVHVFARRLWRGIRRLPGKPSRIAAKRARRWAINQQLRRQHR